jgi:hypothetical protein
VKKWSLLSVAAAVGVVLTIISDAGAAIYAALGFVALWLVQFKVIRRSGSGWIMFGGNPFLKLAADELLLAKIGLAMLLPVVLVFLLKVLWVSHGA